MNAEGRHSDLIPVSVVTGFLGSGKTTLLNALLRHPAMDDTAVFINEFGEVGIDHLLVEQLADDTILLNSGCVCCTVRGDLIEGLKSLFKRRVEGDAPKFARVAIETTGLADPAPIIHTLMADGLLINHFKLDGVVTCVDAVHGEQQLTAHVEAVKQAAIADRLVITKTDGADETQSLLARLKDLNPSAETIVAVKGDVHPDKLFGAGLFRADEKTPDVRRWLREEAIDHHHDHHHSDVNRHDDHIRSFCLIVEEPIPWEGFLTWLEMLLDTKGERILRVKGVLRLEGVDHPVAIHGVQHVFHPASPLPAWPSTDRRSKIVFITRDISKEAIEKTFAAFVQDASALRN